MIKRTERGWAGHFIAASQCRFHRNTLIEKDLKYIIISTVGNYHPIGKNEIEEIGYKRHYETMAFIGKKLGEYIDINVSKQIYDLPLFGIEYTESNKNYIDNEANDMHEKNVNYIIGNFDISYNSVSE